MVLARNSLQIFGFKGVDCKIFRGKELARCWLILGPFALTMLRKVLIPSVSNFRSIHEQGVRSSAPRSLASGRPLDY